MSSVLFNPTDQDLEHDKGGVLIEIPMGVKVKVPDRTANHLITRLGNRGLVSLDYGDDGEIEDKKVAAALKKQEKFEMKQVLDYNYDNEKRKRQNLLWVEPPPFVIHCADKWKMNLEERWTAASLDVQELQEAKEKATKAEKSNELLVGQMAKMNTMLEVLMQEKVARDHLNGLDKRTEEYKNLKELFDAGKFEEIINSKG